MLLTHHSCTVKAFSNEDILRFECSPKFIISQRPCVCKEVFCYLWLSCFFLYTDQLYCVAFYCVLTVCWQTKGALLQLLRQHSCQVVFYAKVYV